MMKNRRKSRKIKSLVSKILLQLEADTMQLFKLPFLCRPEERKRHKGKKQMKSTITDHFTPTRWLLLKDRLITSVTRIGRNWSPLTLLVRMQSGMAAVDNSLTVS
jgi:hypothetical protein